MPNRNVLVDKGEINENLQCWCRSVIGGLHYFARGTRWDVSHAVSRIAQTTKAPTAGTVAAIEWLAGYMRMTAGFDLVGKAAVGVNEVITYTDASHQGDRGLSSK